MKTKEELKLELLYLALRQEGCAECGQAKELSLYEKYKGKLIGEKDLSEYQLIDIKIFSLLEGLGYQMDLLGTYLYKELIHYLYDKIKDISKRSDMDKCREIIPELSNPFSYIYVQVARDYLDMGVKTYHRYIKEAISKIDSSKMDEILALRVYGSEIEEMDYGQQALLFAGYIAGKYSKTYEKPKIKILKIEERI